MVCKDIVVKEEVCTEGDTKCIGSDLYECINGQWQIVEEASPECIGPWPWWAPYVAIAGAVVVGIAAIRMRSNEG